MRLGVAWFHVEGHDNQADGGHVEYLGDNEFKPLDDVLFRSLYNMVSKGQRSVSSIEKMGILPKGSIFHSEPVPKFRRDRIEWHMDLCNRLADADMVFADPDNGSTFTQPFSPKHIYCVELLNLAKFNERPVICIHFPGRKKTHPEQISDLLEAYRHNNPYILDTKATFKKDTGRFNVNKRWFIILNTGSEQQNRIEEYANRMNYINGLEANIYSK